MSIATMRGDSGQTRLAGGVQVAKSHVRVEAAGAVDELISSLGLARSLCGDEEIVACTRGIQKELFAVASALALPTEITDAMVDRLTAEVHRCEAVDGLLADWSVPGNHPAAAAYDLARTVCRRAERNVVAMEQQGAVLQPNVIRYLNRLSDLLWLFARLLELNAGVPARLREAGSGEARWSRAW